MSYKIDSETIYGMVGYTLLGNGNHRIIVMADMHDNMNGCKNKTDISEWFKSKFGSSEIFLEEVPRDDVKLMELWSTSDHTQKLKNLYLKNPKIIQPLDIRPMMIPYSWEILSSYDKNYDITLKKYMKQINSFFTLSHDYLVKKLPNYMYGKLKYTKLGNHFLTIKRRYRDYIKRNRSKLKLSMYNVDHDTLEEINKTLNDIMEWFICAKIMLKSYRPIIIHTGLFHSDNTIDWLVSNYGYNIIKQNGINTIEESDTIDQYTGCIEMDKNISKMF